HTLLTGRHPVLVDGQRVAAGLTVDQHLARTIGAKDPFPSLQLGVNAGSGSLSYTAPGLSLPPENNPAQAFQTLFGTSGPQTPDALQKQARRKAVLQMASAQAKSLAPRLSGTDRIRVEAQMDGLDTLVRRLDVNASCAPPALGSKKPEDWNQSNWDNYDRTPQITAGHLDLLTSALACNLTHVASLQFGGPAANTRHGFIGPDEEAWHHAISHDTLTDGNTTLVPAVAAANVAINAWHMQQLAALVGKLEAMPESDGSSLMDHTTILVVNELSDGAFHTWQNMPFFLVGSAGGHFKTGRYVTFENRYHNDLLVSVLQAMGVNDTTFGDPQFCQGPLPGLT
ncbi:MAG: DUF1552 domain-containing protein, partial [Myxococcales bacterium]